VDIGVINFAYALVNVKEDGFFEIEKWYVVDITNPASSESQEQKKANKKKTIDQLVECFVPFFIEHLTKLCDWTGKTTWLIESQPGCTRFKMGNQKTKVISHVLQALLVEWHQPVVFVSPKVKLKYCNEHYTDLISTLREYKSKYTRSKKISVLCSKAFLNNCPQNEEVMATYLQNKKRDDLSDTLFQCIGYHTYNK